MSSQLGGAAVTQSISLSGTSGQGFSIAQSPQTTWLQVSPATGTLSASPTSITLTANPAGLSVGIYLTALQITSGSTLVSVAVTFNVGSVGASPASLSFTYQTGGQLPPAQSISLSGGSGATFTAVPSANWLQVAPASGTLPATVTAQLNSAVVSTLATGTYNANITITPSAGGAVTVPVTLTVTALAQITINPAAINFFYQIGGSNNVTQQTFTLSTNSPQAVNFGFGVQVDPNPAGLSWLTVSPSGGVVPANGSISITASINPGTLQSGTYNGTILLFAPNATPSNQTIPVHLTIATSPLLSVPSNQINFVYQVGAALPAAQTVTPTSTGTALAYTVTFAAAIGSSNWLTVNPSIGSTPNPFTLTANPTGLTPGLYTGTVTVSPSGAANGPQQIPVTLRVSNDAVVTSSLSSLSFAYQTGQALPPVQSLKISSSTGAALTYTAATTSTWLILGGQTSGNTDGTITVQVNPSGLSVGPIDGTITVTATNPTTGAAVANSPLSIPVRLYVSNTPLLVGNPTALTFTAQVGGAIPQAQAISLSSTSTDQLTFQTQVVTDNGGNWLFVGPGSGSTPNTLVVSVVPSLLSGGTYTGSIRVTATTAAGAAVANSPLVIPIVLSTTQGTLAASPASLTFAQTTGGAAPAPQTIQITGAGGSAPFNIAVNAGTIAVTWLSATPASGNLPGSVSVSVDGSRLSPGTYQGTITVTAQGLAGSPLTIPVTFTVGASAITASPASLTFNAAVGGGAPANQTINVSSAGLLTFTASASVTSGGNWLSVTPASATTPAALTVSVNPAGLAAATYSGSITITSPGAAGSPLTIPVSLSVGTTLRSGVLSHIAAGGPWTTVISLINTSAAAVPVTLNLHGDDGTPLVLPLTTTLQGVTQTPNTASVNAVINPNATLLVTIGSGIPNTVVGWVDVVASGSINGYAIFRTTSGGLSSEGTVPLQTQFGSKLVVPFDNTTGLVTGIALTNISAFPTVTATMYDQDGNSLGTQSLNVTVNGHTSFVLPQTLPPTAGKQGILVLQSTGANGLAGLGLRFSSLGTFTSVPTILAQ
jgi:hypothetical protein